MLVTLFSIALALLLISMGPAGWFILALLMLVKSA